MRIAFLGDSLTQGGYGGDFVAAVARRLPRWVLINAGIGGSTVVNLLRRVDEVLALNPDAIFVMVGGNDAVSQTYPETRPYYKTVQKIEGGVVAPELFTQAYRDLLTCIQLAHVQAVVGLEPTEYSAALAATMQQYNALARDAAESLNIPVLDLAAQFTPAYLPDAPPLTLQFIQQIGQRSLSGWDDYAGEQQRLGYHYTFDGMHLTPAAAELLADSIADFLRQQF